MSATRRSKRRRRRLESGSVVDSIPIGESVPLPHNNTRRTRAHSGRPPSKKRKIVHWRDPLVVEPSAISIPVKTKPKPLPKQKKKSKKSELESLSISLPDSDTETKTTDIPTSESRAAQFASAAAAFGASQNVRQLVEKMRGIVQQTKDKTYLSQPIVGSNGKMPINRSFVAQLTSVKEELQKMIAKNNSIQRILTDERARFKSQIVDYEREISALRANADISANSGILKQNRQSLALQTSFRAQINFLEMQLDTAKQELDLSKQQSIQQMAAIENDLVNKEDIISGLKSALSASKANNKTLGKEKKNLQMIVEKQQKELSQQKAFYSQLLDANAHNLQQSTLTSFDANAATVDLMASQNSSLSNTQRTQLLDNNPYAFAYSGASQLSHGGGPDVSPVEDDTQKPDREEETILSDTDATPNTFPTQTGTTAPQSDWWNCPVCGMENEEPCSECDACCTGRL